MSKKENYKVVQLGNKAERRDYSKGSSRLELPNLVEIQTDSFEWFLKEGIKEAFEEIFPITNNSENVSLNFKGYTFNEPKFSVNESKIRETNFAAPLKATIELIMPNKETGEAITKTEEIFFGDFPLMTDTGTFIINGAERVIVSQIVRSPGAYFDIEQDVKLGKDVFLSSMIPNNGTWLEQEISYKKQTGNYIVNVEVDKSKKIPNTTLLKAVGLSFNLEKDEDAFDASNLKQFLETLNFEIYDDVLVDVEQREFLNHYLLLYTSMFGNYEEILNTLHADKMKTKNEALFHVYSNQNAKTEGFSFEGARSELKGKFFETKKYNLTKAGRYKLNQKLSVVNRLANNIIMEPIIDSNGKVLYKAGTKITKVERDVLRAELNKGINVKAYPLDQHYSHANVVEVSTELGTALVGRILGKDVETKSEYYVSGTVLTEKEVKDISSKNDTISVYAGLYANNVELNADNVDSVLEYSDRLYEIGRILDSNNSDLVYDEEILIEDYKPLVKNNNLTKTQKAYIKQLVTNGEKIVISLVGIAVQEVKVATEDNPDHIIRVVGNDPISDYLALSLSDLYAFTSYGYTIIDGVGVVDEIDMLGNRRVKTAGELINNTFKRGLYRLARNISDSLSLSSTYNAQNKGKDGEQTGPIIPSPKTLINIKPLTSLVKEFFSSSQLSQFMDQQNPLSELTNKRRISALGPGGLTRERAGFEVRDVHNSHYGRICPIETPEGPNIGLITNLSTYAKVNEFGFIQTPYRIVKKGGIVTDDYIYLSADDELDYIIAQANEVINGELVNEEVVTRIAGETVLSKREDVELADVSPKQIVSVATACIPFLENDDASRALMGANMQRQAVPLLNPQSPYVGTGIEHKIAKDSGNAIVSTIDGVVEYVGGNTITVAGENTKETYSLNKFKRSNAGTCINQNPIVTAGEIVKKGDILADGQSMQNGELALGQNVTVAFMTWHGYNYEDAIIMSERIVKEDVYTSIHIEEYKIECRESKLGNEEITRDIPNVSETSLRHLDARGIVMVGAEVKEGDILVGKVTPKGIGEQSPEQRLLLAIFGDKSKDVRDASLKVPHGGGGIVQAVRIFERASKADEKNSLMSNSSVDRETIKVNDLPSDVNKVVKVYIAQKRKISEGDKMAGRHGNKGVISKILPIEDMPYMADGTPVDIMLNPQGVPSRMNIGQVLEIHLGMAAKQLGVKFQTPVFDGITNNELKDIMKEANLSEDGKMELYDGQTGEPFDEKISVGVMYMIKLAHMVDDKLHARATGPYSLITQQPLGGKAQNGGQRFGEMEVWALEAYGASEILSEILTIKSDDVNGRTKTYEAIIKGRDIPKPEVPEAFKVLANEFRGLGLNIELLDEEGNEIAETSDTKENKRDENEDKKTSSIINSDDIEAISDDYDEIDDYKESFSEIEELTEGGM